VNAAEAETNSSQNKLYRFNASSKNLFSDYHPPQSELMDDEHQLTAVSNFLFESIEEAAFD
jgi:hypothetical protein